jgi:hypothetical protein
MRLLVLIILAALVLSSCGREEEAASSPTNAVCTARRFPYDPKNLKLCVDACKSCDNGTTVTCTTSCTLKGAK